MKLCCDICEGELVMNVGGNGATCAVCGMTYSMERLREKLNESKNINTEVKVDVVEKEEPQEEELRLIFCASFNYEPQGTVKGIGEPIFIEYNLYNNKKLEICHDFDEGESVMDRVIGKGKIPKDTTISLSDEDFEEIKRLIANKEGMAEPSMSEALWKFEEYNEQFDTVFKTEGLIESKEGLKAIWNFFTSRDEVLIALNEFNDMFMNAVNEKYKRVSKYLGDDVNEISAKKFYEFILDLYADIAELELQSIAEMEEVEEEPEKENPKEDMTYEGDWEVIEEDKEEPSDAEIASVIGGTDTKEKYLLFSAKNMNWGMFMHGKGEWLSTEYNIYSDGSFCTKSKYDEGTSYFMKTVASREVLEAPKEGKLTHEKLKELKFLLIKFRAEQAEMGCDGEGWEMKEYMPDGSIKHEINGNIYGNENLNKLTQFLRELK